MTTKEKLIESIIRDGYLKNPKIIEAFFAIDRAEFVAPEYLKESYENYPLPIGEGQTISQPLTVAFLLELLDPRPGEKILDIGSGSGWTTALLAYIVGKKGRVFGIERIKKLCDFGETNVRKYNFIEKGIVKFSSVDGTLGLPEHAPYDKILAGAAASKEIPKAWREQLKIDGKIVAPVGGAVWLFIKKSEKRWEENGYSGFAFVPLISDKE